MRVEDPPRTVQVEGEERSTVALGQEVPEELWGAVAAALRAPIRGGTLQFQV